MSSTSKDAVSTNVKKKIKKKMFFKRHPKVCRKLSSGNGCKQDCSYHHPDEIKVEQKNYFKEMMKISKQCNKTFNNSMEMLLHVAILHNSNIKDDIFEPSETERVIPEVIEEFEIELQDRTKCIECKEKFSEKNALQVATDKCMICSMLSYGKE